MRKPNKVKAEELIFIIPSQSPGLLKAAVWMRLNQRGVSLQI